MAERVCSCGLLLTDRGKPWKMEIGSSSALCEDDIPGYITSTEAVTAM